MLVMYLKPSALVNWLIVLYHQFIPDKFKYREIQKAPPNKAFNDMFYGYRQNEYYGRFRYQRILYVDSFVRKAKHIIIHP